MSLRQRQFGRLRQKPSPVLSQHSAIRQSLDWFSEILVGMARCENFVDNLRFCTIWKMRCAIWLGLGLGLGYGYGLVAGPGSNYNDGNDDDEIAYFTVR